MPSANLGRDNKATFHTPALLAALFRHPSGQGPEWGRSGFGSSSTAAINAHLLSDHLHRLSRLAAIDEHILHRHAREPLLLAVCSPGTLCPPSAASPRVLRAQLSPNGGYPLPAPRHKPKP